MSTSVAVAASLKLGMPANWATAGQVDLLGEQVGELVQSIRSARQSVTSGLIDVQSDALDGSGDGEIEYENNNAAATQIVRRVSVIAKDSSGVPSSAGSVYVYVNDVFVDKLSAVGASLNMGESPVLLRRGMSLKFVWDGADASDLAFVSVFYDRVIEEG